VELVSTTDARANGMLQLVVGVKFTVVSVLSPNVTEFHGKFVTDANSDSGGSKEQTTQP
jgi:hypothetical protein